jgi:type IV pilus assembly protein PilV
MMRTDKRVFSVRRKGGSKGLSDQSGIALLEALLAVVIFMVGMLGLIGLQARAISMGQEAQYINQAASLANQMISQVYLVDASSVGAGTYTPPNYSNWIRQVQAQLPGANIAGNEPTAEFKAVAVTVQNSAGVTSQTQIVADVTIHWQLPNGVQRTYKAHGSANNW